MATRPNADALWHATRWQHAGHSDTPIGDCPRRDCQAALTGSARAVPRRPLAFGATIWGPLPGTRDMHLMWPGPGSSLELCATDPSKPGAVTLRIRHPAASGTYGTPKQARAAAEAFIAAGLGSGLTDEESS